MQNDPSNGAGHSGVEVTRHKYDMENLRQPVEKRLLEHLNREPKGCFYINPVATVWCPEASLSFFEAVRREQARWCRQSSSTFSSQIRRRASKWISDGTVIRDKFARFLDRALCFTGLLIQDGRIVPASEWKHHLGNSKAVPSKAQSTPPNQRPNKAPCGK